MTAGILLTGAEGQLGRALRDAAGAAGLDLTALDRGGLDITHPGGVRKALVEYRPGLVINAAAYTAVDLAEDEPERAFAVNRDGAEHLAGACAAAGIPLIHVSTDYVFDGRARRPYRETDPVAPLNVYGRSKAEGEARIRALLSEHVILRTSWLYAVHGRNFLTTMVRLGRERESLSVVDDQVGCPTLADDLARAILRIAAALPGHPAPWGTYHLAGGGETTWYGFAQAIFELAPPKLGLTVREVLPIRTADYPTPARRPAYSVLDCSRAAESFGIHPPPWRVALEAVLSRGGL